MNRATGFLLASVVTGYPGPDFLKHVGLLLEDDDLDAAARVLPSPSWELLRQSLETLVAASDPDRLATLAGDYIDTFDRSRGPMGCSIYETEYGRERAFTKARDLADLAGFYKAFGLIPPGEQASVSEAPENFLRESLDHVAVELEFYALLLLKSQALAQQNDAEGQAIVLDARKKFLTDHLGRFVECIAEREGVRAQPFYATVFRWVNELIQAECAELHVTPVPLDWTGDSSENEEITCGAAAGSSCTPLNTLK